VGKKTKTPSTLLQQTQYFAARIIFCNLPGSHAEKAPLVPRVLIADDNEIFRQALRSMFNGASTEWSVCGEAANGLEGVQLTAKLMPDVVLMDFQMPIMNGLEAAREIARNHPVPIAMYTMHQNPLFETQAQAFGVRKVISKTNVFTALIPSLREIVEKDH
jgi:DNA-binding NarL/FixJ family response regulator